MLAAAPEIERLFAAEVQSRGAADVSAGGRTQRASPLA